MMATETDLSQSSTKKMYALILSAKEPSEQLSQTLSHLIKHSLSCSDHFSFLLHRINWFEPPFTHYDQCLLKIFRLFKSSTKHSSKVIYNLIIEGFFSPKSHLASLNCFISIFSQSSDHMGLLSALKQNYPHKLSPIEVHSLYLSNLIQLCKTFKPYRTDFLQIIIENLTKFDTEVVDGDDLVHRPFPLDQKLVEIRESSRSNDLASKLDTLLMELLNYLKELSEDSALLDELLLVFQNKVLPIKTTKNIQLLIFFVAQSSKSRANAFVSFLLANIFENHQQPNWYRIFTQSNFYLFSYLLRSTTVSLKTVTKTLFFLIGRLQLKLDQLSNDQIDEKVQLKHLMQAREVPLIILQSIILIKLGNLLEDRQDLNEAYLRLLGTCRNKLHYDYFLRDEILQKLGVSCHGPNSFKLKFSNKFLPSTLPLTGAMIDPLMKMEKYGGSEQEWRGEVPRKMHKGETPISYCSQTVI